MVRYEALTELLRHVLNAWPLSVRDLASRANVPHITLSKIANGRLGASPEVAARVLGALEAWTDEQRGALRKLTSIGRAIRRELDRTERDSSRPEGGSDG